MEHVIQTWVHAAVQMKIILAMHVKIIVQESRITATAMAHVAYRLQGGTANVFVLKHLQGMIVLREYVQSVI